MMLRFSATSALIGIMFAMLGMPRTDSQENDIIGTWQLVSAEDRLPDGRIEYPFGEGAIGAISYDATGHMAVQVMRPGRTKWAAFEDSSAESLLSYVPYFGTYEVDQQARKVIHHIQGHLDPKRIGTDGSGL
jgi:hypothetical protein